MTRARLSVNCRAARPPGASALGQGPGDDDLCLGLDAPQVLYAPEALRVELVDVLRPRRPCCEPAALRRDLEASDRCAGGWSGRHPGEDGLSGELRGADLLGRQAREDALLVR